MATPIILPRQGQSVESCIITKWHKQPGDAVAVGDLLFSYETDKSTFDEESSVSGTFLGAFFETGDDVPCLYNVCVIGEPGEDIAPFRPAGDEPNETPAEATKRQMAAVQQAVPTVAANASGDPRFASPRARATAARIHVDIAMATPTGPNGRIIERDVLAIDRFAAVEGDAQRDTARGADECVASTEEAAFTDVPIAGVRKVVARNMMASLQNSAQLTHHTSFDASEVLDWRAKLKHNRDDMDLPKISINDVVLYAVARTLKAHAELNAHYLGDQGVIRQFASVHLGMAVDTERGLLVPTIRNADRLSLAEIAREAKRLAKAAKSGALTPEEMAGATFTISNLGSFGIEMFTPVLNPPQVGILGVCAITQRMRENDDEMVFYPAMGLSLTYDHCAIDGAPASRFLRDLVRNLENFSLLLAK